MTEIEKLAERIGAATGPDRELDAEIFHAIGAPVPFQFANKLIALEFNDVENAYFARVSDDMQVRYSPPHYTASLDAAMSLVPEGAGLNISRYWIASNKGPVWSAEIAQGGVPDNPRRVSDCYDTPTPALALCAAALRARAATK